MKKQNASSPEREREIHAYRREIQDRLNNRPTFDPVLGLPWSGSRGLDKIW